MATGQVCPTGELASVAETVVSCLGLSAAKDRKKGTEGYGICSICYPLVI